MCRTCYSAGKDFRTALLKGSHLGALEAYSTGCVNLRVPCGQSEEEVGGRLSLCAITLAPPFSLRSVYGLLHTSAQEPVAQDEGNHQSTGRKKLLLFRLVGKNPTAVLLLYIDLWLVLVGCVRPRSLVPSSNPRNPLPVAPACPATGPLRCRRG